MTTREKIKRLEELLRCDDDDDRKRVEIVATLEDLAKCVKQTEDFEGIVETSERTFRVFEEDLGVLTSCCRVIRNACARSNQVRNDVGKTKLLSCLIRTIRLLCLLQTLHVITPLMDQLLYQLVMEIHLTHLRGTMGQLHKI